MLEFCRPCICSVNVCDGAFRILWWIKKTKKKRKEKRHEWKWEWDNYMRFCVQNMRQSLKDPVFYSSFKTDVRIPFESMYHRRGCQNQKIHRTHAHKHTITIATTALYNATDTEKTREKKSHIERSYSPPRSLTSLLLAHTYLPQLQFTKWNASG